ncbi:MAG: adenylyltransferase/cytidyltransferase family protein [archaeon]
MKEIKNKKVLIFGTFDILHKGHIYLIKKARSLGDYLIVSLCSDNDVIKRKGKPIFNYRERKEVLSSIKYVDKIIKGPTKENFKTMVKHIRKISPDIITISYLPDNQLEELRKLKNFPKIKIIKVKNKERYSSSGIREKIKRG